MSFCSRSLNLCTRSGFDCNVLISGLFHLRQLSSLYVRSNVSFVSVYSWNRLPLCQPLQYLRYSPSIRTYSLASDDNREQEFKERKLSLFQRFKQTYAIYGKVVLFIHGVTSCMWLAGTYLTSLSGINLLQFFEAAHFPDWMCKPLRMGGGSVNQWATALVLYKLIAPFRYGFTLVLSRYAVRYLRAAGKAPPIPEQNRLRSLARESAQLSRERLKVRLFKERARALALSKKTKRDLISKYRR